MLLQRYTSFWLQNQAFWPPKLHTMELVSIETSDGSGAHIKMVQRCALQNKAASIWYFLHVFGNTTLGFVPRIDPFE